MNFSSASRAIHHEPPQPTVGNRQNDGQSDPNSEPNHIEPENEETDGVYWTHDMESVENASREMQVFRRVHLQDLFIENRASKLSFTKLFRLLIDDGTGRKIGNMTNIDMQHGDKLSLMVENLSQNPLYYTLFNVSPMGRVTHIRADRNGFFTVAPRKKESPVGMQVVVHMGVPEELRSQGQYHCDHILQVIITEHPKHIVPLLLPLISRFTSGKNNPVVRESDRNLDWLSGLDVSARDDTLDGCWATWSFHIHVTKQSGPE